ncbi:carotenoid biosynthesis protein [Thermophagus sp. OGC60D27]|uniref:carotenoid biosynthesis protein n=1 Tax=Thermophagus sp. OGC60D27 TaxID=3458415 RepID=UPI004037F46B
MRLLKKLDSNKINRFWYSYFLVGFIGFSIPATRQVFMHLTGFTIFLSTALMLWFHKPWESRFILSSLFIFLLGFIVEALGVHTQTLFGPYSYGKVLGPKLFNTPILIGLNWWMLIYMVWHLVQQLSGNLLLKLIVGSCIMVGYDLFLEPIAIASGMWHWNTVIVPLQNYLVWFILSFLFLGILGTSKTEYKNPVASELLLAQIVFFVLLNIVNLNFGL